MTIFFLSLKAIDCHWKKGFSDTVVLTILLSFSYWWRLTYLKLWPLMDLVTESPESQNLNWIRIFLCSSRKYPYLPQIRNFPLEIPIHFFNFFWSCWPSTPRKFQSLLWEEYGYFLELQIWRFFYYWNVNLNVATPINLLYRGSVLRMHRCPYG